ncbi:hypothetical protein TWF481_004863 [Arthrobotrys musiformis]|uniref:PNPLA domain-containing protein n=1 Tax=Arthrobotrys musiformis TaxID=47236 RepID=A0AAV9WKT2_9PEZI
MPLVTTYKTMDKVCILFETLGNPKPTCLAVAGLTQLIPAAEPDQIYGQCKAIVIRIYQSFIDSVWPCEFTSPNKPSIQCIGRKISHADSHQAASGKYFDPGTYETSIPENFGFEFEQLVRRRIERLHGQVGKSAGEEPESTVMASIHSQNLRGFYRRVGGARKYTSTSSGARAIIELEILASIERDMGYGLNIMDFFDLIVGTSGGGIIGLGLGAKGWSVSECRKRFEELYKTVFTIRRGAGNFVLGSLIAFHHDSRYRTRPLEHALRESYDEEMPLLGGAGFGTPSKRKVAVVTTLEGQPTLLANYNRTVNGAFDTKSKETACSALYQFQRAVNQDKELKIWEAARATSAAPFYFKPFTHKGTGAIYVDGGIQHNNPAYIAESERKLLWPESKHLQPDIFLSLGTGINPRMDMTGKRGNLRGTSRIESFLKILRSVAEDRIQDSPACEKAWNTFFSGIPSTPMSDRSGVALDQRYIRLNVPLKRKDDPPELDDTSPETLKYLITATKNFIAKDRDIIRNIANSLLCSAFYFEVLHAEVCDPDETRQIQYKGIYTLANLIDLMLYTLTLTPRDR